MLTIGRDREEARPADAGRGVQALSVRLTRAEVHRRMGYPRSHKPAPRIEARVRDLWEEALALLDPRGAFRTVPRERAAEAGLPHPSSFVGLGLCTIGPDLERLCAKRAAQGASLDAMILDAVGSAAAEATADALNKELCAEAGNLNLFAEPRVSPGYGSWDVACQPRLLALLPAGELGIALTPGLMMVPRKSVSFAVNLVDHPPPGRARGSQCARCGLERCPYASQE